LRGAWDSLCTDADAARLLARWGGPVQDVRLPAGTHLMHLEQGREALYAATNAFLTEET
jgi:pimeloyl-ACP methyl ester carboxylesterase